jgi:hypothetical protein
MNLNPTGPGSLSAVLGAAAAGDTIVFASGLSGTVTPSSTLTVTKNVTIQGPGAGLISVSGGDARQVFNINTGVSATISGLTITHGKNAPGAGDANGGAIDNEGSLALLNDVVSNSAATSTNGTARGAGVYSPGLLTLQGTTVSGNTATGVAAQGGGVFISANALSIIGCTITGNMAIASTGGADGGGVRTATNDQTIADTVFTGNTASNTGGGGGASGGGLTLNSGNHFPTTAT